MQNVTIDLHLSIYLFISRIYFQPWQDSRLYVWRRELHMKTDKNLSASCNGPWHRRARESDIGVSPRFMIHSGHSDIGECQRASASVWSGQLGSQDGVMPQWVSRDHTNITHQHFAGFFSRRRHLTPSRIMVPIAIAPRVSGSSGSPSTSLLMSTTTATRGPKCQNGTSSTLSWLRDKSTTTSPCSQTSLLITTRLLRRKEASHFFQQEETGQLGTAGFLELQSRNYFLMKKQMSKLGNTIKNHF